MLAHKRRIAEDVVNLFGGDDIVPVHAQGVAADDPCGVDERQAAEVLAELFGDLHVHLVIGEPERHLRDLRGELFDLDAEELIDIHLHKLEDVEVLLPVLSHGAEDFEFELSQFAIGDDQKVPAPAGRVEELQPRQKRSILPPPLEVSFSNSGSDFFDRFFERGDAAARDAKNREEVVPEALCLGAFGPLPFPFSGKGEGPVLDLVQGKGHALYYSFALCTERQHTMREYWRQEPFLPRLGQAVAGGS